MIYKKNLKTTSIKCDRCYGTGKVVYVSIFNKLGDYRKINCRKCNGTGINPK